MRSILLTAAAGAVAASIVAGAAFAQATTPEVVVTSHKPVEKGAGRTTSGIPIVDVSLSYTVSAAGLDLASHEGAQELEKRVQAAAVDACKELASRYPLETPSAWNDTECAKAATNKAMVKVRQLEAAAAKK